jgi:hypothetical protein
MIYGERRWDDTDREKPNDLEKNLSQCHFVRHKSHIYIYPGTNPGLHAERPATNDLSHGTAMGGNTIKSNSGIMYISVAALSGNLPRHSRRLRRVLIRRMDEDKILGATLRWKI